MRRGRPGDHGMHGAGPLPHRRGTAGRTAGLAEPVSAPNAATASDEEAALWMRDNLPAGTVFATNRTSSTPAPADEDGISNLYTAFSGCSAIWRAGPTP